MYINNKLNRVAITGENCETLDYIFEFLKKENSYVNLINDIYINIFFIKSYDMLIIFYSNENNYYNELIKKIRKNSDIYILLIIKNDSELPDIELIENFNVQMYCELSVGINKIIMDIKTGLNYVTMMKTLKSYKSSIKNILDMPQIIYHIKSIDVIMEKSLMHITEFLNCNNSLIIVNDPIKTNISTISNDNYKNKKFFRDSSSLIQGIGKYDTVDEEIINSIEECIVDIADDYKNILLTESYIVIPLKKDKSNVIGNIFIEFSREAIIPDIEALEIFSEQLSSIIINVFLFEIIDIKDGEINNIHYKLKSQYMEMIETLRKSVEAKDFYTRGHSDRVSYYSFKIGEKLGLSKSELETLRVAGIFHDIGKIGTSEEILLKNGRLTNEEFDEIKKHPLTGANILSTMEYFKDIIPAVRGHHERIDGRGYPDGLKGDEIPLLARIVSVADAFDAMTSDRNYRPKLNQETAKEQLIKNSGIQFDEKIVKVFIEILEDFESIEKEIKYTFEKVTV
jgi:putative nucleotidyltransferase with HDIG domain